MSGWWPPALAMGILSTTMSTYLVPCDCGADIPVRSGQAGETVVCGSCGRVVPVPRLRDLGRLRVAADEPPRAGRWSLLHAVAVLGGLTAALALPGSVLILPRPETVSPQALRDTVNAMSDIDIYFYWNDMMSKAQARRIASPDEKALNRRYQIASAFSTGLQIAGGFGAVAAAVAWFAIARNGGSRGGA